MKQIPAAMSLIISKSNTYLYSRVKEETPLLHKTTEHR